MNIFSAIESRRTIHNYTNAKVPDDVIERAVRAANFAPNHKLTYPWRILLTGPKTRNALAELQVSLACDALANDESRAKAKAKVTTPGALFAVTCRKNADAGREREDYASVSCAIQNMMLSLWADGYGSKWSTGKLTFHEKTYAIFDINKEKETIVGFVWAGKPEAVPPPIVRPNIADVFAVTP